VATKNKRKRGKKRSASIPVAVRARNHFSRGDFKAALKFAKLSYRDAPNAEQRSLLECVYVARAQQLAERGQRDEGRRVLDELLTLGIEEPSVAEVLPDLLLLVGRVDKALARVGDVSAEASLAMQQRVADQAVLHFEDMPRSMLDYTKPAAAIRDAIDLLHQGEADSARARLAGIDRKSPFSDWVFFVRGLAAYYARDDEKMHAYWARLDAGRAAARLAEPLFWLADPEDWHATDSRLQRKLKQLERKLTGHTVLPHLADFRRNLASEVDAEAILPSLRALLVELKSADSAILQQVTRLVISRFVRVGDPDELDDARRMLKPLPHDPNWNAALALSCERSECDYDSEDALQYWRQYVAEVSRLDRLSAEDRRVIQGLVYHRLAGVFADMIDGARHCECGQSHEDEIAQLEPHALRHFTQALDILPEYLKIYEDFVEFHEAAGRPDEALAVRERCLRQFPDDIGSLQYMARVCLYGDNPRRALDCARRLHELQPLDANHRQLLWSCHLEAARQYASEGQADRGLAEFAHADRLMPERMQDGAVLARRVAFAKSTGREDEANRRIGEAVDLMGTERTAFWLNMAIEYARYQLPEKDQILYEKRWLDGLERRRHAATMARMCATLNQEAAGGELLADTPLGQLIARYRAHLLPYVERGGNLKWNVEQLTPICWFLVHGGAESALKRIARSGLRRFPDEPLFHACRAHGELNQGPYRGNFSVVDRELNITRQLLKDRHGAKNQELVDLIDRIAARYEKARRIRQMMPFGFNWTFDFDDD